MRIHRPAAALVIAALLAMTGTLSPEPLTGQSTSKPLFIAIPERFPDVGARVVLVREPNRELVLLDPMAATADELATGLRLLDRLRRERAEPRARRGQMIPIVGFAPGPNLSARERARLEAMISELRARPMSSVGTLGQGRWMRYDAAR